MAQHQTRALKLNKKVAIFECKLYKHLLQIRFFGWTDFGSPAKRLGSTSVD